VAWAVVCYGTGVWTIVFACASNDAAEDPDSGAEDATTVPDIVLEPDWTVEEAMTNAQASLAVGLPDSPAVRDLYFDLLEVGADEDCPGGDQLDGSRATGCTADSGYFYQGHSVWEESDQQWTLSGDFEIITPEGSSFWLGGQVVHRVDLDQWSMGVEGTMIYEGADDWLWPGASAVYTVRYSEGLQEVHVDGGLTANGVSFVFEDVHWARATEQGPGGTVLIRDPVGAWFTLVLDATSGCGPVSYDGEELGTGCLDLASPILELIDRVEASG
jgi:hypothetical protein